MREVQKNRDGAKPHLLARRSGVLSGTAASQDREPGRREGEAYEGSQVSLNRKVQALSDTVELERSQRRRIQSRLDQAEWRIEQLEQATLWSLIKRSATVQWLQSWARRLSGAGKRRERREAELVGSSPLFDRRWYLLTYPDVGAAGIDPLKHFMTVGWREGRDPGPEFATSAYLKANPDVARSGTNPLTHYLEFGLSEGRGTAGHRSLPGKTGVTYKFEKAAPCLSFPIVEAAPVRWTRAVRLVAHEGQLFEAHGCTVGYTADPALHGELARQVAQLRYLSGQGSEPEFHGPEATSIAPEELIDGWYINDSQLRTRWGGGNFPFVVRALQYEAGSGGRVRIVAEGLVHSPLDSVDSQLLNPFYPLLFIFAEPDGRLRGARLLAFPSLCRGGVHYPELLLAENGDTHPLSRSEVLADCLLVLRRRAAEAAVKRVKVDLRGADGTGPIFRRDFRQWLQNIMQVAVSAREGVGDQASAFLSDECRVRPSEARPGSGATLVLSGDMVPTIAALVEARSAAALDPRPSAASMLIAGAEPSQPAIIARVPADLAPVVIKANSAGVLTWPLLEAGPVPDPQAAFPPAAVRGALRKPLSDAELLVPMARAEYHNEVAARPAVTWLVRTEDWSAELLAQALRAAVLQDGGQLDAVMLVGRTDPDRIEIARKLFADRVQAASDMAAALPKLATPLIGYLGSGVVQHDARIASTLASLLADATVGSASCVLVLTEKRGKAWHAAIAAAGTFAAVPGKHVHPAGSGVIEQFWRSTYPVAAPPQALWMARLSSVSQWVKGSRAPDHDQGGHLCTSLVTASLFGNSVETEPLVHVPGADHRSIQLGLLFG